ncbi:MAG: DUF2911 domain-containing protein [Opitutus sp.]
MNKFTSILIVVLAALCTAQADAQQPSAGQKKQKQPPLFSSSGGNSPHETFSIAIGGNRRTGSSITITYGRPNRTHPRTGELRKVWGGLVPWDKADRLGADEATTILTQHPIEIAGAIIPAGIHTLYIVPSGQGATKLAFSRNVGKWGVPVDETQDVARVDLKKDTLPAPVDRLTLAIEPAEGNNGVLKISWDDTQWSVPFAVRR